MTPNGAYFAQFGAHMPDFNLRNPAVVAYHLDSLRFWLNHGVDGFRIDAVGPPVRERHGGLEHAARELPVHGASCGASWTSTIRT